MMKNTAHIKMEESLRSLLESPCWSVIAGQGTGSMASLNFGRKFLRVRQISNPHISEDARLYNGEFWIFVKHCAWRLDTEGDVICGSTDDNSNDGLMVNGLQRLVGQTLENFELHFPGADLTLFFSGSLTLRIFCDQLNLEDEYDNYTVAGSDYIYTVGTRSKINQEPRVS